MAKALRPPPSARVMNVKKQNRPGVVSVENDAIELGVSIPNGAKTSWSSATLFKAGPVADFFVMGKARDKNPNHWNCMGAMKKP